MLSANIGVAIQGTKKWQTPRISIERHEIKKCRKRKTKRKKMKNTNTKLECLKNVKEKNLGMAGFLFFRNVANELLHTTIGERRGC